jgi:ketosteroid isomerase-like protein
VFIVGLHFFLFFFVYQLPAFLLSKLVLGWSRSLIVYLYSTEPFAQPARLLSLRACQVRSEDSEEVSSGESIVLDEQTLMRELQVAIEEENYTQAAKIRDSLKVLQEDSKASVLSANARFYNAFRKGDLAAMQSLWEKADNVCCVHPGASGVLGYDDVMESWEVVWMNYDFPLDIELKNVRVHFRGDVGYVTCVEFVRTKGRSWGAQFVTNVFEKIDGQWFISIHHASPVDL